MESTPGTYLLIIRSIGHDKAEIGKHGLLFISPGWYLYIGSAFGSGGVRARVSRHLRSAKKLYWHIDFLLASAALHVEEVWWTHGSNRYECQWGKSVEMLITDDVPMVRFGSSDCRCATHLFFSLESFPLFRDKLLLNIERLCDSGSQSLSIEKKYQK